ncbi:MAG: YwaF family protein [Clostridia bacterium]|nr:YwaF family protein [Clostridia bacterium]
MNPQVFGKEHLTYVIICVVAAVLICVLSKIFAKTEKAQQIVVRCAGGVLFAIIFANRLALVFEHENANWLKIITDSFCSTSSYVFSIAALFGKKDNSVLHFLWFVCLAGGLITTFYPNFIGQHPSFMYPPTILGMLHHTFSAVVSILILMFGWVKPSIKRWKATIIGMLAYLSYGAFLMCVLGYGNPFYMTKPAIDGTPFTAWVIIPIYLVVHTGIVLVFEFVRKRKQKKLCNNQQAAEQN